MNEFFSTETCVLCTLNDKYGFLVKEVMLFRAISEYIDQIELTVDLGIVTNLLVINNESAISLKNYFLTKFSPDFNEEKRAETLAKYEEEIDEFAKNGTLSNLIVSVFKNITRTNYFLDKESIAFKVELKPFKHLLKSLQPNYEIFVYHPEFMGLHLRMTHVSRGGLRWSERADFREEIKSLMITQDGKNSIIVPAGAKGGFYIDYERDAITKEMFNDFYSKFIHNLLDMVDNRVDGEVVTNKRIVKYDEDDTYFVVAADKGTAQMSDVANSIAISRNFWLGDAFASGGSNGYSHKDLGITAKGSFVSTERFFIEREVDFHKEPISVVGIGSMNGDVFGNGILLSREFKLLGAFSHREIFIDPNPEPEISFRERERLFNSDNGSWSQYNTHLISKGGGVFRRKTDAIEISAEMKEVFGIEKDILTGDEMIRVLLTADVDLLFNGGVGTYVKASSESSNEVGDYGNLNVRVDAKDVKAFAVCEGGNLGFTQKGRVEYALKGGKINLDGIDNSAGVNTSDHEVNLKVLLSLVDLSDEEKSVLLKEATDEVVEHVLKSNYNQALGLSLDEKRAETRLGDFISIIELLEKELPQFNRDYFAIVEKNEDFVMNRPNLSFLFSYSKILLKKIIIGDEESGNFLDEFFSTAFLHDYFPSTFYDKFKHSIPLHPLKREIIGTVVSDRIINAQGVTFLNLLTELGEIEFRRTIERYLKIEKLVKSRLIREKLGVSAQNYEKLIEFEDKLRDYEKSFREFGKLY
jgi:glutamate dehydrogenase